MIYNHRRSQMKDSAPQLLKFSLWSILEGETKWIFLTKSMQMH